MFLSTISFSKISAVIVSASLLQPGLWAQQPAADNGLKITVVQGQNEKNNIKLKLAVIPIIEVRDERDRLIPGVRVSFVLPNFGPGGKFADGTSSMLVWTDTQGRAAATGMVPNSNEGKFAIRVSATYSGKEGSATILQENTPFDGPQKAQSMIDTPKKKSNKIYYILAAAGGAAALGLVFGLSGSKSSSSSAPPPTPTSVSFGSITVGGPH